MDAYTHAYMPGETLVISVSDHETGGLSLGRDPVVRQPSAAFGPEAPLRTHSLIGEAEGVTDTAYAWHPEVSTAHSP